MYALTQDIAGAAGLPAYEISNHARPGEESRHNLTYWRYGDYAGIGPGAHGRRSGVATERHRKPENWLAAVERSGHGLSVERPLGAAEQAMEALLMGLRLSEGVDLASLGKRFGIAPESLVSLDKVKLHEGLDFVTVADLRIAVTPRGMPLLDALLGEIVAPSLVAA